MAEAEVVNNVPIPSIETVEVAGLEPGKRVMIKGVEAIVVNVVVDPATGQRMVMARNVETGVLMTKVLW